MAIPTGTGSLSQVVNSVVERQMRKWLLTDTAGNGLLVEAYSVETGRSGELIFWDRAERSHIIAGGKWSTLILMDEANIAIGFSVVKTTDVKIPGSE